MARQGGFTLIEVMVVTLILGILMAIAGPDAINFIRRSQSMSAINELISDLNMARSESIKRRTRVVVCSRQDDTTCGAATQWNSGYIIFSDTDRDGVLDAGEVTGIVKVVQSPGSLLSLGVIETTSTTATSRITFRPSGGSTPATTTAICTESGAQGKIISVALSGQITSATITCP